MIKLVLKPLYVILIIVLSFWILNKLNISLPLSMVSTVTNKNDVFTVDGQGKVTAKPDTAQINLGVTVNGNSVSQVQSQANETMNKITSDLKNLGASDKDIKTTNYSLNPNYDYRSGSQKIIGYVINIYLTVKTKDFNKINQMIDAATKDGANQVGGLSFVVDDPSKFENEARKLAIDNAKQKAQKIANEAGLRLGRVLNVSESQQPRPQPVLMNAAKAVDLGGAPEESTQVEPGSTEIVINVTLSYETR
ncbi:MAG: SIMPL domain-containing protein [Patescibacteria group bacterium]|nr:SIMPL domain-containing protein [Patescibacteria group bacterium]